MTKMWRGPCQAVKDTYSDPLASAIIRRCSANGLFFNLSDDGRSAEAFTLQRRAGDWHRINVGTINGLEPIDTMLRVAFEHTPFDRDFINQKATWLLRKAERLAELARMEIALCHEIDALIAVLRV